MIRRIDLAYLSGIVKDPMRTICARRGQGQGPCPGPLAPGRVADALVSPAARERGGDGMIDHGRRLAPGPVAVAGEATHG